MSIQTAGLDCFMVLVTMVMVMPPVLFGVGGEYYADKMDHIPGTLTASAAIIADVNKKIDQLLVDNVDINGNTIATTNTNGNLVLDPNGFWLSRCQHFVDRQCL